MMTVDLSLDNVNGVALQSQPPRLIQVMPVICVTLRISSKGKTFVSCKGFFSPHALLSSYKELQKALKR
jgi:hypothetical protein